MTPIDQLSLNRAALTGDVRAMRNTADAVSGITSVMRDENIELTTGQRDSLLAALKIVANGLDERADLVAQILDAEGAHHD